MKRKVLKWLGTFVLVIVILAALQRLVMPKYMSESVEGNMIAEYYSEKMDHDVIFVGDCEVYSNFSPAVLWEEYGINSYIRGSAEQLVWQSYYLVEETLTYETPDVIVFNVLSMEFDEPQRESYNRMTLDGMRWSGAKVRSIWASMTDEENFIDYVFPLLRYHSRITELTEDDFAYFWERGQVSFNGYYMRVDALAASDIPEGRPLGDYTFGETAYSYLDRMVELCEKNDVELVLIKAPSLYPYWYDEWEEQIVTYAQEHELRYYNFLNVVEEIGLDYNQDTYDGLHLNLSGAEKLSRYFGEILTEELGLINRRGEEELEEEWSQKLLDYYMEEERQQQALEME